MTPFTLFLLQSALSLPPIGYLPDAGRLYPIYGFTSNFLTAPPLPEPALAAHRWDTLDLRLSPGTLDILAPTPWRIPLPPGPVVLAWHAPSTRLYAAFPSSGDLHIYQPETQQIAAFPNALPPQTFAIGLRDSLLLALTRQHDTITLHTFRLPSLQPIASTTLDPSPTTAAFDSLGNLWLTSSQSASCATTIRHLPEPIQSLLPLDHGWMILTTPSTRFIAQCHGELSELPTPPPQP